MPSRKVLSYDMQLKGTPAEIFPLPCPVREYEWIEHWDCDMVYTESGVAEQDCIFTTAFPQDGPEEVWVTSKYDPPARIEFVRVNSLRVIRYTITLKEGGHKNTNADWRQIITGLSDAGDIAIEKMTKENYDDEMQMLQKMLNHFVTTGEMLRYEESKG